eukprot:Skav221709  [mRNA]  locus=scaffold542:53410:57462:- [translate_table: standard]
MLPFKISPTTSWATLVPLVSVLFVTFCKDAYEDLKRWRDDCRVNNQTCKASETCEDSTFTTVKWSQVQVGSFVKLHRDQPVPADLLRLGWQLCCVDRQMTEMDLGTTVESSFVLVQLRLLYSRGGGGAFVDTAQLDGESALKPKQAIDETQHMIGHSQPVEGRLEADPPNELVTKFDGCLYLKGYPRGTPVDLKNMVLRGSTVRNTACVIGLVVYTGSDTKMVRNSSRSLTSKRSQVEVLSNKLLATGDLEATKAIIFLLLFLIAIGFAVARAYLVADEQGFANLSWVWPHARGDDLQDNPYMAILTFLIGYNNLIPISLYMTIDLVRAMQAFLMERDESMNDTTVACTVRSSSLCEDLGQVDFVLSDKTGTLTQNQMCFKACYVDGQVYGYWAEFPSDSDDPDDRDDDASMNLLGHPSHEIERVPPRSICLPLSSALWHVDCDPDPVDLADGENMPADGSTLQNFFLCLATCHEGVPESKGNQVSSGRNSLKTTSAAAPALDLEYALQNDPGMANLHLEAKIQERFQLVEEAQNTVFRSPSPDEEALLAMARDFGFFLRKKEGNQMTINVRGQEVTFTVLLVNEFSSERKRMSVLVHRAYAETAGEKGAPPASSMENLPLAAGQFLLFSKGADSAMMERMVGNKALAPGAALRSELEMIDKRSVVDGQQSRGLANFRSQGRPIPKFPVMKPHDDSR